MARENTLRQMSPIDVPMGTEYPEEDIIIGDEELYEITSDIGHNENLAEIIPQEILDDVMHDLLDAFEEDWSSEEDWRDELKEGYELLGASFEEREQPFKGACGATHPLLAEAGVQFQSSAYKQLCPSTGPAKIKIVGKKTREKEEQATRVKNHLNYYLQDVMPEYEVDTDQMLFHLPFAGSMFRKIYYDRQLRRCTVRYIDPSDFVASVNTTDLATSPRYTQIIRKTKDSLKRDMHSGLYVRVDLQNVPSEEHRSEATDAALKIENKDIYATSSEKDNRYEVLEMHVDINLTDYGYEMEEFALPFIVTIIKDKKRIIGFRRNWKEDDDAYTKRVWFSHYRFLPGLGFKGWSLFQMVGGLARASTAALRQLVDAGTLSNLPAGYKRRGSRIAGGDEPIQPGEWRDVDYYGERVSDIFFPLPYKEPSTVLFQLLGFMVEAGQRYTTTSDPMVGDGSTVGPVGTTVALIEQGQKVFTAIHKRLYAAQRHELVTIAELIRDTLPEEYPYDVEGGERDIKASDYDDRIDIIPVADPNISSSAQRIAMAQAGYQMAQGSPQIHDMYEVHRKMYSALEFSDIDAMLPPPEDPKPMDPVTENMAMLHLKPVKAYEEQDHNAHIAVHQSFMKDPRFGQDKTIQQMMGQAMMAHIAEHGAFQYKKEMEQAGAMVPPTPNFRDRKDMQNMEPLGQQQEQQSSMTEAQAAPQVLQKAMEQAANADPQKKKLELEVKKAEMDLQGKQIDVQGKQVELQKKSLELEEQKHETQEAMAEMQIRLAELENEQKRLQTEGMTEIVKLAQEAESEKQDRDAELEKTALESGSRIATAEIQSKTALETTRMKIEGDLKKTKVQAKSQQKIAETQAESQEEINEEKIESEEAIAEDKIKSSEKIASKQAVAQRSAAKNNKENNDA